MTELVREPDGLATHHKQCHSPGECDHLPGKPWCAEHQARLDRIRGEVEAELGRTSRYQKSGKRNRWGLGPRQVKILTLLSDGYTNTQIAERMGIAIRTVETQLWYARFKMSASSNSMAAQMWREVER